MGHSCAWLIFWLIYGYSSDRTQRELSNKYHPGRVLKDLKYFCIRVTLKKVASASHGLRPGYLVTLNRNFCRKVYVTWLGSPNGLTVQQFASTVNCLITHISPTFLVENDQEIIISVSLHLLCFSGVCNSAWQACFPA